ncbi:copper resistance protein B [Asticcacaulis endophyticus]|uniref:Copper resistance protein B n=1 Tax=Asticcacaulis endophyticus TaxID=1395890 RepID=A0A918Q278_9CAUL|nr:copper resistance protein B [Asticcacaulis endophyticus]GGZ31192.1 hypothetical protein GCM10011273_17190 [Asticcacaulis endophyticus]
MTIITKPLLIVALIAFPSLSLAAENATHDHVGATYHAVKLETDFGRTKNTDTASWDVDAWFGGDTHKLKLISEGELTDGDLEEAEVWGLYSRNIATFWDAQVGVRYDAEPKGHTYLTAGVEGLAPYFFETGAHLFVRDDGAVSARLRQENEWLLTNRLIMQPYAEVNLNAKEDALIGLGSGLTSAEIGLQTRYEFSRRFAPYVDLRYERKFGDTAEFARAEGEKPETLSLNVGIRWLF